MLTLFTVGLLAILGFFLKGDAAVDAGLFWGVWLVPNWKSAQIGCSNSAVEHTNTHQYFDQISDRESVTRMYTLFTQITSEEVIVHPEVHILIDM